MRLPSKRYHQRASRTTAWLDEIKAEILKHGDQTMVEKLAKLFNKCWQHRTVPDDWSQKKRNIADCTSWQGISLLSVLLRWLWNSLDQHLREEQTGFRSWRSCSKQIFSLQNIIEQCVEYQQKLTINFMDFKKTFDSIHKSLFGVSFTLMAYQQPSSPSSGTCTCNKAVVPRPKMAT